MGKGSNKEIKRSFNFDKAGKNIMINITIRVPKKLAKQEVVIKQQSAKKYQKKVRMEVLL